MSDEALILTVAPNGAYKRRGDHPALPLTPDELAQTAKACLDAGAAMLHLHVRRPDGAHSLRADDYRAAIAAVRRAVGEHLVIQVTTEAAGVYTAPEQIALVHELRPEAVSVSLRELSQPALDRRQLADLFEHLRTERIMTQVIFYDADEVRQWQALQREGVIPPGPWLALFVLGRYRTGQTSLPADLLPYLQPWDLAEPWAMCAFGAQEYRCAMAAAALGGHVRVGFENNQLLRDGTVAPDNAALLHQAAQAVQMLGRPLADAAMVRARFAD